MSDLGNLLLDDACSKEIQCKASGAQKGARGVEKPEVLTCNEGGSLLLQEWSTLMSLAADLASVARRTPESCPAMRLPER